MTDPMPDDEPGMPSTGTVIGGNYVVHSPLRSGGMGAVVRALDVAAQAFVAIKFLRREFLPIPIARERFDREGVAAAAVRCENVVRLLGVGATRDGTPYLVMELLEGVDLLDLLARDGDPGLPMPRAVHFALQILHAAQAAHASHVVHRDLKLSNCVVVNRDGDPDFVKVLDFGISKLEFLEGLTLTRTNSVLGTPIYMAPEQALAPREVDARSDLYSVGVALYKLLAGSFPYAFDKAKPANIVRQILAQAPTPLRRWAPGLPQALEGVVHRAIAFEQRDRFPSALAMAEALAPFADGRSARVLVRLRGFDPRAASTGVEGRGPERPVTRAAAVSFAPVSVELVTGPPLEADRDDDATIETTRTTLVSRRTHDVPPAAAPHLERSKP